MNYSGFFRAVETYHFPSNCEALGLDPFPIGKGSYKSTNGRLFHCSLVVYPLDTGSKISIHKSGGEVSRKKKDPKKPWVWGSHPSFYSFGYRNRLFPWISKNKQKPDLLDLQDSGTRHHQDDMKQSKTWWWKQIPSNPGLRGIFSFSDGGNPEVRMEVVEAFESHGFFRRCFFGKEYFFGIIQSDQNRKFGRQSEVGPTNFCIWCYKYQLMVLMFLFDMDPSTSKHKEIEQFRILPFPAVWKIGRP